MTDLYRVVPVQLFDRTLRFLLAPVQLFLDDPQVSEVMINGAFDVRVERAGRIEPTEARFANEDELLSAVRNVAQYVGKRITPDVSTFDSRLPGGARVHVMLPPVSRQGICVSIRKFSRTPLTLAELVTMGSMTEEIREFLEIAVAAGKNLMVAGGTGSGKTTLLNSLSSIIPAHERILVLEDASELQLLHDHVLYFECRAPDRKGRGQITIRDLFHASLRMRPDRIIVGECRSGEAMDMIQALTSGHGGSMTTLHANSPADALRRLETMALMSGVEMPLAALRSQIASAAEILIQTGRRPDGSRKILAIAEALGLDSAGNYRLQELYSYRSRDSSGTHEELVRTGARATFGDDLRLSGLDSRVLLTRGVLL